MERSWHDNSLPTNRKFHQISLKPLDLGNPHQTKRSLHKFGCVHLEWSASKKPFLTHKNLSMIACLFSWADTRNGQHRGDEHPPQHGANRMSESQQRCWEVRGTYRFVDFLSVPTSQKHVANLFLKKWQRQLCTRRAKWHYVRWSSTAASSWAKIEGSH